MSPPFELQIADNRVGVVTKFSHRRSTSSIVMLGGAHQQINVAD
jgi:hypothetical protein